MIETDGISFEFDVYASLEIENRPSTLWLSVEYCHSMVSKSKQPGNALVKGSMLPWHDSRPWQFYLYNQITESVVVFRSVFRCNTY